MTMAAVAQHPYQRGRLRVLDGHRGVAAMVTIRATLLADLQDEIVAAGQEMVAAGRRIEYAIRAERDDIALHECARLQVRGAGYAHPEDAA